jgi:hypothetical protein
MVEELVIEVRDMRLILERLLNRKLKGSGKVGKVLGVEDLSRDEVWVLGEFIKWLDRKVEEWGGGYKVERVEGFDEGRGIVILSKETMYEFLDSLAVKFGYKRHSVLGLLADVGLLKFWQTGGKRQFCIAVRVDKPMRGGIVSGRFVIVYDRFKELKERVGEMMEISRRVKGMMVASEPMVVRDEVGEGGLAVDTEDGLEGEGEEVID